MLKDQYVKFPPNFEIDKEKMTDQHINYLKAINFSIKKEDHPEELQALVNNLDSNLTKVIAELNDKTEKRIFFSGVISIMNN